MEVTEQFLEERIWPRVEVGDCWEWTGWKVKGYGYIRCRTLSGYTHRIVWEALVGPIPAGLVMDHICRNPACCNPDHLEVVTQAENVRRGYILVGHRARYARITHCKHGHEFTPDNTAIKGNGTRKCRACARERDRRRRRV